MSFFKKLFGRGKKENLEKKVEETKEIVEEIVETAAAKVEEAKEEVVVATDKIQSKVKSIKEEIPSMPEQTHQPTPEPIIESSPEPEPIAKPEPEPEPEPIIVKAETKPEPVKPETDFWGRKKDLNKGLEKTKVSFFGKLSRAVAGKSTVDEEVLDEVEQILITSDVGLETTIKIIERIEARVAKDKYLNTSELNRILRDEIVQLLAENNTQDVRDFSVPAKTKPYVMLVVGVNGVGKTTTIGKLAYQLKKQGKKVVIGAGDTFRAAAVDQLEIWANRVGCEFFSKGMYADPAAVAYETTKYAIDNNCDVAIIDTAGRLHTKINLMKELGKIKRSIGKSLEGAPHDVMLVLDATTGQNAIEQATKFTAATEVSCLALTKLDGTAKGGVAIGISDQFKIPIKYIGIGEGVEQLQVFNKVDFVDSMFGELVGK